VAADLSTAVTALSYDDIDFSLSDNRGVPVTQDVRGTAIKAPDASPRRNPRATAYRTRRRRARRGRCDRDVRTQWLFPIPERRL